MDVVGLVEWSSRSGRRRRVAVLLFAAVAAGLVGWYVVRELSVRFDLADAVAAAGRDDPRWQLADLEADRAAVPDAQNGALVVLSAAARLPGEWYQRPSCRLWPAIEMLPPDAPLTDGQYATLLADVESEDKDAVAAALTLARCPAGRYPTDLSSDFAVFFGQPQKDVAYQVYWRILWPLAHVHVRDGDMAAALRDYWCVLNLARTFGDQLAVWAQGNRAYYRDHAVRLLERVLAHDEVPSADLATLQAELVREAEYDTWAAGVRAERAVAHELFTLAKMGQRPHDHVLVLNRSHLPQSIVDEYYHPGPPDVPPGSRLRRDHAALLRATTRMLETARLPAHEQAAALRELQQPESLSGPVLTRSVVNRLLNRFATERIGQAKLRSVVAALAVERFRLARGRWPESLADVVPEFLAAVPADPFDGQPLRYRRTAGGVVIYSIGPDGADDGGTFRYDPPRSGPDVGCVLRDAGRRRQPPQEKRP